MTQLIRVSKPGINAITGTAPNDLNYSSDYNTLKYYTSGTINVVVTGTNEEGTVAHSLGYVPFFTAFVNGFAQASSSQFNMCPGVFTDIGIHTFANAYADSSNLYFKIVTNSASTTYTFRYFIFRNNTGL